MDPRTLAAFTDELEKIAEHRKVALTLTGIGNVIKAPVIGAQKLFGRGVQKTFGSAGKALAGTSVGRAADQASVWGGRQVGKAFQAERAAVKAEQAAQNLQKMSPAQRLKATAPTPAAAPAPTPAAAPAPVPTAPAAGAAPGAASGLNWKHVAGAGAVGVGGGALLHSQMSAHPAPPGPR